MPPNKNVQQQHLLKTILCKDSSSDHSKWMEAGAGTACATQCSCTQATTVLSKSDESEPWVKKNVTKLSQSWMSCRTNKLFDGHKLGYLTIWWLKKNVCKTLFLSYTQKIFLDANQLRYPVRWKLPLLCQVWYSPHSESWWTGISSPVACIRMFIHSHKLGCQYDMI